MCDMIKGEIIVILLLYLVLLPLSAYAQPYCSVRTFSIADGLGANTISDMEQSDDGTMWIATWNGLCNYDGYTFKVFRGDGEKEQVLSTNRINIIESNSEDDLWCVTYDSKVYLFDCEKYRFESVNKIVERQFDVSLVARNVVTLGNGYSWILGKDNISFRVSDRNLYEKEGFELFDSKALCGSRIINKVVLDDNGQEWVFASDATYLYNRRKKFDYLFDYVCNVAGKTYLASPNGQFAIYDSVQCDVRIIPLPKNIGGINNILAFDSCYIVIATESGSMLYDVRDESLRMIRAIGEETGKVVDVYIDKQNRIWSFRADGNVSLVDISKDESYLLRCDMNDGTLTTSKNVLFHEDTNGTIWIVPKDRCFSYYDEEKHELVPYHLSGTMEGKSNGLNNIVKALCDKQSNLWVTGEHNLLLVNFNKRNFFHIKTLDSHDARAVCVTKEGEIWVGLHSGHLAIYDSTSDLIGFVNSDGKVESVESQFANVGVYAIYQDSKSRIWIGTKGEGLYKLERRATSYDVYEYRMGKDSTTLSSDNIYDIIEDTNGNIWVGTYGGGLCLMLAEDIKDGYFNRVRLANNDNNQNTFEKIRRLTLGKDGEMIVATTEGIVLFDIATFIRGEGRYYYTSRNDKSDKSLYTSDVMQVYETWNGNRYVITMGGGLQQCTSSKTLQDDWTFTNIESVDKNEGLVQSIVEDEKQGLWLVRDGSLNRFDMQTGQCESYGPNDWNGSIEFTECRTIYDTIRKTIVVGSIGGFLMFAPADISKSNYSPNIVFSGVRIQGEKDIHPMLRSDVFVIPSDKRNTMVYFSAIDFSGDINAIRYAYKIRELDDEWNYIGQEHGVSFNHIPPGDYSLVVRSTNAEGVWQDNDTMLLVTVQPTFWESHWAWMIYVFVVIVVVYALMYMYRLRNKAIIEKRMKEKQLEFFTNISHQLRTPLTLISGPVRQVLEKESLTHQARRYMEFVDRNAHRMLELVDKTIDLKRLQDVNIDIIADDLVDDNIKSNTDMMLTRNVSLGQEKDVRESVSVLIVEDNDELRFFLTSSLVDTYNIYQAKNGMEGLQLAIEKQPDFIVTDIMMPVMDGMSMVRKIKITPEICHIPIIVLSARASLDYRIEGLNEGIDDYITKPFSVAYLKSRMKNIIHQRALLQERYVSQFKDKDSQAIVQMNMSNITDSDKAFIEKLSSFMEENISNANLKIDDIAKSIGMSRTVFYVKLKNYFGLSPIDFIRKIRMQNAEKLIKETSLSFSEIAYKVGFTDAKYFGKCFKADIGLTPSEYRKKYRKM